jgi:hypothetical protein
VKYLPRVAKNKDDTEARRQLLYICVVCPVEVKGAHLFFPLDWRHLSLASGLVMLASISVTA